MWSPKNSQSRLLKAGDEAFRTRSENVELAVFDYWRWANSGWLDNAGRGVLAEFLVAHAFERMNAPRREWGRFDVSTESGIKVDVKTAAYAQSWPHQSPSKITFNIAPWEQVWDPETNEWEPLAKLGRTADVYVFCLLGQPDDPVPRPLRPGPVVLSCPR